MPKAKVETHNNLGLKDDNTPCIFQGCYAGLTLSNELLQEGRW